MSNYGGDESVVVGSVEAVDGKAQLELGDGYYHIPRSPRR